MTAAFVYSLAAVYIGAVCLILADSVEKLSA
jgi:hypothetical protein